MIVLFLAMKRQIFALVLAILVFVADQASKRAVINALGHEGASHTVTPFFDIVLVLNEGISFGMLNNGHAYTPYFLMGTTVLIVAALLVWLFRTQDMLISSALGLLIGGAIGNLVDRIKIGAVVDFLSFHVDEFAWPAFNVADSAVVIGVMLLLVQSLVFDKKERVSSPE